LFYRNFLFRPRVIATRARKRIGGLTHALWTQTPEVEDQPAQAQEKTEKGSAQEE
jgi:hypothetical protein